MDSNQVNIPVNVDTSGIEKSGATIKQLYRAAQAEVVALSEKFGETSKQALAAAKAAAEFKDQLQDAKALSDAFNPDNKFVALAGSLQGVAAGFELVTGAQALFGQESENVEKILTKVQGAMALSRGLEDIKTASKEFKILTAQVQQSAIFQKANAAATTLAATATKLLGKSAGEGSKAFNVLKGAIIGTGIGALVVGLGLLIANFDKVKDAVMNLIPGLKAVADFIGGLIDAVTDFFGITSQAERDLDKQIEESEKKNKSAAEYYERNSYKYDEFTQRKIKANMDYQNSILELNKALKDGTKTESEAAQIRRELADKANFEINEADKGRAKKVEEGNKKIADDAKKAADEAKKRRDEAKKKKEEELKSALGSLISANEIEINKTKEYQEQHFVAIADGAKKEKDYYEKNWKKLGLSKGDFDKKIVELDKKVTDAQEKQGEIRQDIENRNAKARDTILLNNAKTTDQTLDAKIQQIKTNSEIELQNEKLTADERIAIESKANSDILALRKDASDKKKAIDDDVASKTQANELTSLELEKKRVEGTVGNTKEKYNKLRSIENEEFANKQETLNQQYEKEINQEGLTAEQKNVIQDKFNIDNEALQDQHVENVKAIDDKEKDGKMALYDAIGNAASGLSEVVGKETVAGKALAVASALINTYKGIAAGISLGYPAAIPAVIAAAAAGFLAVKNILAVKVPAKGGYGGSAPAAPSTPSFAAPQLFGIGGQKIEDVRTLKDQKVVVVESDITRAQSRSSQVKAASIQGG